MFLAGLILAAATAAVPLSAEQQVTPAVKAVVDKYRGQVPPAAVKELEALLAAGDGSAGAFLAEWLMFGDTKAEGDWPRACDYSEKAGRHASALHNLATCHFLGNGRPRDLAKARMLYEQAGEMGFAKAACAFGNMLITGQGGEPEVARGLDLFRRAADAGEADAQTDYGGYLLIGRHTARDAVKARHYLSLAAERKQANAAFLLGHIYWNGDGVDRDRTKAALWWTIAHDGGRPDAAHYIGREAIGRMKVAHEAGRRIPDAALEDAEKWMRIAAEIDPDPGKRANAAEQVESIIGLRAARRRNGSGEPD